jgi:hypothetical protein
MALYLCDRAVRAGGTLQTFLKELEESDCVTLKQLHKLKGKGFAPSTVKKWIAEGKLKPRIHYIKLPGTNGSFKISLVAFNNYLELPN